MNNSLAWGIAAPAYSFVDNNEKTTANVEGAAGASDVMKGNEAERISKEHISMTQTVPESSTIGAFVDSDFRGIVVKYRGGPVFLKKRYFRKLHIHHRASAVAFA